jgi:hypothetical protein
MMSEKNMDDRRSGMAYLLFDFFKQVADSGLLGWLPQFVKRKDIVNGSEKGSVLVIVIAGITIIAAIGAGVASLVTSGARTGVDHSLSVQAYFAAESGLEWAEYTIEEETDCNKNVLNNKKTEAAIELTQGDFLISEAILDGNDCEVIVVGWVGNQLAKRKSSRKIVIDDDDGGDDDIGDYVIGVASNFSSGGAHIEDADIVVLGDDEDDILTIDGGESSEGTFITGDVYAEMGIKLSSSRKVIGDLHSSGDITLSGASELVGNIFSEGDVEIKGSAKVEGSIYAKGDIEISGGGSNIDGDIHSCNGSVTISGGASAGVDIYATGNVNISGGSSVGGSVYAAGQILLTGSASIVGNAVAGETILKSGNTRIDGNEIENAVPPVLKLPVCPDFFDFSNVSMPVKTEFTAGGINYGTGGGAQSADISPGSYGNVNFGGSGKLYLQGGNYYFQSINYGSGGKLYLDLSSIDDINIFIKNSFQTGGSFEVFVSMDGTNYVPILTDGKPNPDVRDLAARVYLESHGDFNIGGGQWFGTVHSPDGTITFGSYSGVVVGALYGDTGNISGAKIYYVAPNYFK